MCTGKEYLNLSNEMNSWLIRQNVKKVTPVTDKMSEWLTENVTNVNKFRIETFSIYKESSVTIILNDIRQTFVTQWVSEIVNEDQTDS